MLIENQLTDRERRDLLEDVLQKCVQLILIEKSNSKLDGNFSGH